VVGLVTPPLNLKLDDFEVAEVFEPPLEFLLDSATTTSARASKYAAPATNTGPCPGRAISSGAPPPACW
jgi:hypothetical protein